MNNLFFAEKHYLWLLLIIPFLIFIIFFREKKYYGNIIFSNFKILKKATNNIKFLRYIPDILRILAVFLIIVAIAKPKFANGESDIEVSGIDIAFVLDISTSMAAADFMPKDRLTVAKEVISDFITKRKNDRLALVVFNALSYVQAPLTLDHKIFDTLLKAINMDEIQAKVKAEILEDGTAIGNALGTAVGRLIDSDTKSKIIILLTDGSNNKGNLTPEKAADMAAKSKIKIYPILIGKTGKVPYPAGKDYRGNIIYEYVENSVNPELLKKIATETKAKFYTAQNRDELEHDLMDIIDHLEQSKFKETNYQDFKSEYHLFILTAFVLLLIDFILRITRYKRLP